MTNGEKLLEIEDLRVHFPVRGGIFRRAVGACKAVDGVTLSLKKGQTLGLVGESGCGKSTLAKAVVKLIEPTHGSIRFKEKVVIGRDAEINFRKSVQMVFQDPAESLNSRMTVGTIIGEPLDVHQWVIKKRGRTGLYNYSSRWGYLKLLPSVILLNFQADSDKELALPVPWL